MKLDIIISLILTTCSLIVFCAVDVKAEASVHLSVVNSAKSAASELKVFRRSAPWTPEEDARLVRLRDEGMEFKNMVKNFQGRSLYALRNRYFRLTHNPFEESRAPSPWTAAEEERLVRLRDQGMSWDELDKVFPKRSWHALSSRYYAIKKDPSTSRSKMNLWTRGEQELLLELMKTGMSYSEVVKRFPGRSKSSIYSKYKSLTKHSAAPKAVSRKYTAEENKLLLRLGNEDVPWKERVKFFDDRSLDALKIQYGKLTVRDFTSKEDQLLLQLEEDNVPWKERKKLFKGRTIYALVERVKVLLSGNFTSEEDGLLLELEEEGVPWQERVTFFNNRTLDALQKRLEDLASKPARSGRYSSEEDDLLIEAAESGMVLEEISELLERDQPSVDRRIKRLIELKRFKLPAQLAKGSFYTDADFELMEEKVGKGMSFNDIAAESFPGRTGTSVRQAYNRYLDRKREEEE